MATPAHFTPCLPTPTNLRTTLFHLQPHRKKPFFFLSPATSQTRRIGCTRNGVASEGDSYLDLWKKAVDRERKVLLFQKIAENTVEVEKEEEESQQVLEKRSDEFKKLLEVPKEERDRIQRMQVIDRAAAAIAAARALLKETPPPAKVEEVRPEVVEAKIEINGSKVVEEIVQGTKNGDAFGSQAETLGRETRSSSGTEDVVAFVSQTGTLGRGTPGPDFWSWSPPLDINETLEDTSNLQASVKPAPSPNLSISVMEKEPATDFLSIPFQSTKSDSHNPPLPPLQSFVEIEKEDSSTSTLEEHTLNKEQELDMVFSANAAEAADALLEVEEVASQGVHPDGSKYWKETGIEQRPDGVVCRWTVTRGVSADGSVEWEEKFWDAAGQNDYKELGSEKSGRDATGNVWREYWKESMWQDQSSGLIHMEKTADKWGKNGNGGEWHEKWWEHYDASGHAEKWADKWCSIDPNTPLEAGHAHVWHERWGEKYDGQCSSIKYTDKWAERLEGDGWTKWGDKWDENFNQYGHGVKQGETWWQGKYGEQWNRTWGEHHNGSGWIHKYGKSSCGEHWDTHVQQDTWYERYPHFGFDHCFENSVQLREVRSQPETP